jgi:hypothetical protein
MLERSGLLVGPAVVETPSDAKVYPTKFSDLNSYFQALQTRLGVTVAVIALIATATGTVGDLLPSPPSGGKLWLVYATAALLAFAFFLAGSALALPGELPWLVEARLASRTLAGADDVDPRLHGAFMKEIRRRHTLLDYAYNMVGLGIMWLGFHALLVGCGTVR